jgi:hypothetical protein
MKSTPGQECCASYFDYPFATLQLATLQLAKCPQATNQANALKICRAITNISLFSYNLL